MAKGKKVTVTGTRKTWNGTKGDDTVIVRA